MDPKYIQLTAGQDLPDITGLKPFLTVLVLDQAVDPAWQTEVSRWLVRSGCIYMMAWGINCSEWDAAVDFANIEQFNYGEIPEDELVMTSWHAAEDLKDVFWQAKYSASHACVEIANTLILHIANVNKEEEYLSLFEHV